MGYSRAHCHEVAAQMSTLILRRLEVVGVVEYSETLVPDAVTATRLYPAGSSHQESAHDDKRRYILHD